MSTLKDCINKIKDSNKLNITARFKNLTQDYKSYSYEKHKKILYGRTSRDYGSIDGEYTVIEVDGKRLLGDF